MKRIIILFSVLLIGACSPIHGFLESEFTLSPDSKLPTWFSDLPKNNKRENITIYLKYYTPIFNVNDTVIIVKDGWQTLYEETGMREHHPKYWAWAQKDWPQRSHPSYVNITINGKTEIIEHKKMEPFFYISNEEAIKQTLGESY